MMNVSTLTVLLVCVILECAQSASVERGWERFSPRSKRSTLNSFSVVENWNSVCEEVCSTGFGGPGCGVGCNAQTSLGHTDISKISAFRDICPALCENYLGITKCNCALSAVNPNIPSARNALCSATCSWRMSLNGCSKCGYTTVEPTSTVETTDYSQTTIDEMTDDYITTNTTDDYITTNTTDDYITTNTTDVETPTTDEHSTDEEDTTTEEYSSTDLTDPNEDDSTTDEEPTTTTSTTTTTQPTTTTTRSTTPATTTPNWESLCEALCRNGEGGSLCNCDIPPFF